MTKLSVAPSGLFDILIPIGDSQKNTRPRLLSLGPPGPGLALFLSFETVSPACPVSPTTASSFYS